jgi:hypothetical protein
MAFGGRGISVPQIRSTGSGEIRRKAGVLSRATAVDRAAQAGAEGKKRAEKQSLLQAEIDLRKSRRSGGPGGFISQTLGAPKGQRTGRRRSLLRAPSILGAQSVLG